MTKAEMIERLEVLLARVRTRSAEPRRRPATPARIAPAPMVAALSSDLTALASPAQRTSRPPQTIDGRDSRERLVATEPTRPSAPPVDDAEIEVVTEDEQPPPSSRRPIAAPPPEERLAQMAFGTEEPRPPLHTPPPESGRLPAAPAIEFDPDVTGVRTAPPPIPAQRPVQAAVRELVPEAIAPHFVPSDRVADVVGETQRVLPSTFVALLDASLALQSGT